MHSKKAKQTAVLAIIDPFRRSSSLAYAMKNANDDTSHQQRAVPHQFFNRLVIRG
jgi:hypothetical protein